MSAGTMAIPTPAATRPTMIEDSSTSRATRGRNPDFAHRSYVSEAAGLDVLLAKVQPRVCFFGHHHTRVDTEVEGVRCIGLNKVGRPGNLVAIDMEPGPGTRGWSLLGEFGRDEDSTWQIRF